MSAIEPLCSVLGINPAKLSKEESLILEMDTFARVCEELKNTFRIQFNNYFRVMKFNARMEDEMMEAAYVRCIINDLLLTEEYLLPGIACYTNKPEDVIYEIATGKNTDPSSALLRKIVELHRSVRPDLYREVIRKIIAEHSLLKQ